MIRTVAETGSTNADMLALARAGAPHGAWLRAETQSGGRGRQGRVWASPPGNLYASTIVRLYPGDPPPATLALTAAVALDEVVAAYAGADRVRIKWPNDLLLDGAKLSGILLERADDAVVVGFGVNLAHRPAGTPYPATSLAAAGIEPPDAGIACEALADAFARWLSRWRGGLGDIRARWGERAHGLGTPLLARLSDGTAIEGLFDGLDRDGALRLRTAEGVRTIHAGDVFPL